MVHTQSATPLQAVQVECRGAYSDVWLRRAITHDVIEFPEGSQEVWEADEVHGTLPGTPTTDYVSGRFAQLWASFEEADLTDRELIELRADTVGGAVDELAALAAETADATSANSDSIEVICGAIDAMAEEIFGGGEQA